jgi:oligosaccharide repeat unit polymerase
MKLGSLINPFLLFPFAFLFLIGMYSLGWSDLFPRLEFNTYFFIFLTSIVFFIIWFFIKKTAIIKYSDLPQNLIEKHNPLIVILFMIILFVADVLYSGTIPFLAGNIEDYENFGMPMVDPIILSMIVFYSIYWFHTYLTTKEKKYLVLIFFNILMCVLMARRSVLVYVFISFLLIYVQKQDRIKKRSILLILLVVCSFSWLFGYLGNMKTGLDSDHTTTHMGATQNFYNSGVSNEHYITYLYVCSPIANFQLTINKKDYNHSFGALILGQFTPDFVANKINSLFGFDFQVGEMQLVMSVLNVGTFFAGTYIAFGWLGIILGVIYMILFAFCIYFIYPKKSPYQVTINAFLCSIFLTALFSNTFRLGPVWFVFFTPLVLNFIHRIRIS